MQSRASSRTRDSTTRPCRWPHMFLTSAVGLFVKKHLVTGADSLYWKLDVSSLNGQGSPWSEVARHHPQQANDHAQCLCARIPESALSICTTHEGSAPRRRTAFPTLEGTMVAWQEVSPVLPELRKVVDIAPSRMSPFELKLFLLFRVPSSFLQYFSKNFQKNKR